MNAAANIEGHGAAAHTGPHLGSPVSVLELREILRILLEHRWVVLGMALAGLLLGLASAVMTTPLYRASVLLAYDPNATASLDETADRRTIRPFMANQEIIATQTGMLYSDALSRRVAEQLHLVDSPKFGGTSGTREQRLDRAASRVRSGISVSSEKASLLIRLNYSAPDPAIAAKIANALAKTFIAMSLERKFSSTDYARKFLGDQLAKTQHALESSESALNQYAINSGLFRSPGQTVDGRSVEGPPISVTDLGAMETALNDATVKRIAAENAYRHGSKDSQASSTSAISTLVAQRATLQAEYSENEKLFKADYPEMRETRAKIEQLNKAIATEQGRLSSDRNSDLAAAYKSAAGEETALAAKVAQAKQRVREDRARSVRYTILQREADTNRSLYDALLQRYKEVGIAGVIGQSNISLVDPAREPQHPFRPRLFVNLSVGLAFGLLAGLASAFALYVLFDRIIDPSDVRNKLFLQVVGVIPRERGSESIASVLENPASTLTEAYYSSITSLRYARPEGLPRTVFITSSQTGEGKSTSSFAIASSCARLGMNVLLIDADLRRPTFSNSASSQPGFAHLLASGDALAPLVVKSATENLSLLPVGAPAGSPAELLSSARLPAVLAEASGQFDLVVLDGPPVLGLTDAPLLGSVADATLLVVESRRTRIGTANDTVRRLRDAGASIFGVILTKVSRGNAGYGYYDSYTYGAGEPFDSDDRGRFRPQGVQQDKA
ncbi:GumC family protein [Novosphingobium naphthalenivorans]|uniref:GumC family protein n=1 Tax=Novosphingobium naphthalenivorans TaxID=273168 RepID=UPI0008369E07|nr:polysaccharide biosynthesis tyrosine autokinase [Novosphingobium naphthalenivorans]